MPCRDFFERSAAKPSSPINMAPRPLSKSPVSFLLGDEVPHIVIRESHQRPREILISGGKRLFQQQRPISDIGWPPASCQLTTGELIRVEVVDGGASIFVTSAFPTDF